MGLHHNLRRGPYNVGIRVTVHPRPRRPQGLHNSPTTPVSLPWRTPTPGTTGIHNLVRPRTDRPEVSAVPEDGTGGRYDRSYTDFDLHTETGALPQDPPESTTATTAVTGPYVGQPSPSCAVRSPHIPTGGRTRRPEDHPLALNRVESRCRLSGPCSVPRPVETSKRSRSPLSYTYRTGKTYRGLPWVTSKCRRVGPELSRRRLVTGYVWNGSVRCTRRFLPLPRFKCQVSDT